MSADLKKLYPFTGKFLEREGLRYHYLDEGNGAPVVMVHGNPSWSFYYRNLVLALRNRYRCIVPDHIGCGFSDKPGDTLYDYTLAVKYWFRVAPVFADGTGAYCDPIMIIMN